MKETASSQLAMKLLKSIEKEKNNLQSSQGKETWHIQKPNIKITADFSSEAPQVRRQWGNTFRGLKGGSQGGILCLPAPHPKKSLSKMKVNDNTEAQEKTSSPGKRRDFT